MRSLGSLEALYWDLRKIFGAISSPNKIAFPAGEIVRQLRAPEVESAALRIQEMADENRSITSCILEVVAGVLDAATHELEGSPAIRGDGDDGRMLDLQTGDDN